MEMIFKGPWFLKDLENVEKNGFKVFSCFHCGGGSTMGYKLAGFEVLGGVEIDPKMMAIYRKNHKPKHSFLMGVQDFNNLKRSEIPDELFELDILDGSPPCSAFSMAGSREEKWGKKSHFREGQAAQVLDDLFFRFIETAELLNPKIVIAENVTGLIKGAAKGYVKMIKEKFDKAGYDVQLFLLNGAFMGVPQRRERVFFVAHRKDLKFNSLKFDFKQKPISIGEVFLNVDTKKGVKKLTANMSKYWAQTRPGDNFSKAIEKKGEKSKLFSWQRLSNHSAAPTLTSTGHLIHPTEPRFLSDQEHFRIQSFPDDFDVLNSTSEYICGMSVPPYMMANIASEIEKQWLTFTRKV